MHLIYPLTLKHTHPHIFTLTHLLSFTHLLLLPLLYPHTPNTLIYTEGDHTYIQNTPIKEAGSQSFLSDASRFTQDAAPITLGYFSGFSLTAQTLGFQVGQVGMRVTLPNS